MGLMRRMTFRGAWWLVAWLALAPGVTNAQQYAPADPHLWLPLGSTRPEDGGFYVFANYVMFRQTNPLRSQPVAVRGLFAYQTGGTTILQRSGPFFEPVGT